MSKIPDLRKEVTVFVITIGAPSFNDCMKNLKKQDCRFNLEIIKNQAPLSKALQCMLDRCRTPYFVQVDEDMILNSDAVRRQYYNITNTPKKVAIFTSHLFDIHPQRLIYGFKIYRHEIVKNYPYQNVEACEFDQISRFKKDGFIDKRVPIKQPLKISEDTLGYHGPMWEPLSIYERYFSLTTKQRRHSDETPTTAAFWVKDYAKVYLKRFIDKRSELDLYAFMGIMAGMLASVEGRGAEKDFRKYGKTPGFNQVKKFVQTLNEQK